ncbi:3-oxo-5-alpha-steroid 4-dehydrogenase [Purpureocillium lavendulum]|uniref:3-oxo-5-alpha-steroid 4-dehydrogenase n=1 Tax=Purpureocillium lavendulum TaxID=1247861 RepID=A0AB34FK91_9HYPO|nr:3-oxo-5-alpha-steroid 4-dehydrogenase [Purpureocillium lavendulum]
MAVIEGWLPPTRAHYDLVLRAWQFAFPPWLVRWYGMGKTSVASRFNIPGRVAWMTMEAPGFLTLLYLMNTMPAAHGVDDLPWQNRVLGGLFVIHYSYRAIMYPLLQPSMAPIHGLVWAAALCFQLLNATCLGAWLSAYGPVTADAWAAQSPLPQFALGMALFYVGLAGNFFHDEELREIRRRAAAKQQRRQQQQQGNNKQRTNGGGSGSSSSSKTAAAANINGKDAAAAANHYYEIPQAGLFRYMLYPHYFCEWAEWLGFLVAAGWTCAPAWAFLVNEVVSMLPRAVNGRRWYVERFGADKVGKRWAIIPGVL